MVVREKILYARHAPKSLPTECRIFLKLERVVGVVVVVVAVV